MNSKGVDLNSISTLVPLAKAGDHKAQSELFEQIYDAVARMAKQQFGEDLRQRQNPSDVVQQTMTRMIHGFEDFRGHSENEFFGWLQAIMKNEIHLIRRNQKQQKRDIGKEIHGSRNSAGIKIEGVGDTRSPCSEAIANEKVILLQKAMDRLPDDSALVIRLRNLEELSFNEIAEKMGRSYNAVAKLWQRAVVQLEKSLDTID